MSKPKKLRSAPKVPAKQRPLACRRPSRRVLPSAVPRRLHRRYHRVRIAAEQVGADQQHEIAAGRMIGGVIARDVPLRIEAVDRGNVRHWAAPEVLEIGRVAPDRKLAPQQLARERLVEPDHERLDEARIGLQQHRGVRSASCRLPGSIQAGDEVGQRRIHRPAEIAARSSGCSGSAPVPSGMRAPNRAVIVSFGSSRACSCVAGRRQRRRSAQRRRIGRRRRRGVQILLMAPPPCRTRCVTFCSAARVGPGNRKRRRQIGVRALEQVAGRPDRCSSRSSGRAGTVPAATVAVPAPAVLVRLRHPSRPCRRHSPGVVAAETTACNPRPRPGAARAIGSPEAAVASAVVDPAERGRRDRGASSSSPGCRARHRRAPPCRAAPARVLRRVSAVAPALAGRLRRSTSCGGLPRPVAARADRAAAPACASAPISAAHRQAARRDMAAQRRMSTPPSVTRTRCAPAT